LKPLPKTVLLLPLFLNVKLVFLNTIERRELMLKLLTVFSRKFLIALLSTLKLEIVQFVNLNIMWTQMVFVSWEFSLINVSNNLELILARDVNPITSFLKIRNLVKFKELGFLIKWPIVPIWFTRKIRNAEFARKDIISRMMFVMSVLLEKDVLFAITEHLLFV
jgi:hypothetical protein